MGCISDAREARAQVTSSQASDCTMETPRTMSRSTGDAQRGLDTVVNIFNRPIAGALKVISQAASTPFRL